MQKAIPARNPMACNLPFSQNQKSLSFSVDFLFVLVFWGFEFEGKKKWILSNKIHRFQNKTLTATHTRPLTTGIFKLLNWRKYPFEGLQLSFGIERHCWVLQENWLLWSFARVSFGSQNPNETACEDLSLVHVFHFLHNFYPPLCQPCNKVPIKIEEFNYEKMVLYCWLSL